MPGASADPTVTQGGRGSPKPIAMRFGLFGGAQAPRRDDDPASGFLDYVNTCVEAETLGFASTFLVEHHFSGTDAAASSRSTASARYGTPDQIVTEIDALRAVGVQHVLLHAGHAKRQTLSRFSTQIMPEFT